MRTMRLAGAVFRCLFLVLLAGCGGDDGSDDGSNGGSLGVTLSAPADGATVSGIAVGVQATVSGASGKAAPRGVGISTLGPEPSGAATVRFFVDDIEVHSDDSDPYFFEWNSTTVANGLHEIRAVATDGARTASDQISVIVNNEGGDVAVVVTPINVQLAANQTQQFEAQVLASTDQGVTWSVDGGAINGTITANGLYTAPANLPGNTDATVRATSAASPGVSGTATVTFQGGAGVTISISPPSASVQVNSTLQFTATLSGTTNPSVNWQVEGGAQNGSISSGGLYTAPAAVPSPSTVTIRATAAADPSATSTAIVTITPGSAVPKDELDLLVTAYSSGFDVLDLVDGTNELVFQAIFFASCQNGSQPTITGTITETGPEQFTWIATPADRLILDLSHGQYIVTINPETIDGDIGDLDCDDWELFKLRHIIEYSIQGPPGNLSIGSAKVPTDETTKDVSQVVQGSLNVDGETWQVNAEINGIDTFFITTGEFSSSRTTWDLTMTGTLQSGGRSITINHRQTFEDDFNTGPSGTTNIIEQDNLIRSTGTNGAVTWAFSDVFYNWDDTSNTNPLYEGGGSILRNGTPFATFVVDSQSGAAGIQLLGNGEIVPF